MSPRARDAACVIAVRTTARAECDAMPAAHPFLENISPKIARRMLYLSFSNVLLTDRVPNAAEKNCKMKSEEFNTEFLKIKDSAFRYALSLLRDRHAAEDAAQDLYEKLWRRRERDRLMTGLEHADRERQADRVDCDDVTDIVRRLTDALPPREREAMHLRNVEGMEYYRIAELTGTSEAAARMACSRARNKIRDELTKIMNHGL